MNKPLHALLVISVATCAALAQTASDKLDYSDYNETKTYDKNKDGKISLEEFKAVWESDFKNKDNSSVPDGKLYPYEINVSDAQFRAWDTDQSGFIDMQEWLEKRLSDFHRLDANHDGVLEIGVEWTPKN